MIIIKLKLSSSHFVFMNWSCDVKMVSSSFMYDVPKLYYFEQCQTKIHRVDSRMKAIIGARAALEEAFFSFFEEGTMYLTCSIRLIASTKDFFKSSIQ